MKEFKESTKNSINVKESLFYFDDLRCKQKQLLREKKADEFEMKCNHCILNNDCVGIAKFIITFSPIKFRFLTTYEVTLLVIKHFSSSYRLSFIMWLQENKCKINLSNKELFFIFNMFVMDSFSLISYIAKKNREIYLIRTSLFKWMCGFHSISYYIHAIRYYKYLLMSIEMCNYDYEKHLPK